MGGSYGGYATLAGLAFTPDKFACGVDIVGPSNLKTLLDDPALLGSRQGADVQAHGQSRRRRKAWLLKERSPLYKADQIKRPLLIGQGANDPRVNVRPSPSRSSTR
jgi:dipeptidyl aminopeptidase/acylaminoacyl peptidase